MYHYECHRMLCKAKASGGKDEVLAFAKLHEADHKAHAKANKKQPPKPTGTITINNT